jgi:hypothetical protein
MDFDIGNILYIIITLVAVLIGVLGKRKKPAEGGSGAPSGEARPSFMENLERMLTMDQEQPQIKDLQDFEADLPAEEYTSEVPEEQIQAEVTTGSKLMQEYEQLMSQRGRDPDLAVAERGRISDAIKVIDLEEEYGTDYFEIVRDFDAGTAVVYSAIINRLDY